MKRLLSILACSALLGLGASGLALAQDSPSIEVVGQPVRQGTLFVSGETLLQVVVEANATDVSEVSFSYTPTSSSQLPGAGNPALGRDLWTDDTPEDGWFLPVNASRLPAGSHRFSVHAYGEAGNPSSEVARLVGDLEVERIDTPAWPWVLPGETAATTNPYEENAVTVELAEPGEARLFVNGQEVELSSWRPPPRDGDLVPRVTVEERGGTGFVHRANLSEGDVLRVVTNDTANLRAGKGLLVGHGVDAPVLEVSIPGGNFTVLDDSQLLGVGTIRNLGLEGTEYDLTLDTPEGWNTTLSPSAGPLAAQSGQSFRLSADIPADAASDPDVAFEARYQDDGEPVTSRFPIPLQVEEGPRSDRSEPSRFAVPFPSGAAGLAVLLVAAGRRALD